MNNEEILQIVTLLTTVLGCITGILTFFSKLKETSMLQTLQQLVLVVLPIIYLAKIFAVAEKMLFVVSLIAFLFYILTCVLSMIDNTSLRKIAPCEVVQLLPCGIAVLGQILQPHLPYPFGVSDISQEIQQYLNYLSKMKVSLDMYLFMMNEYAITMLLLQKAVLLYLTLRSLFYMSSEKYAKNLRMSPYIYKQNTQFTLISACINLGLINWAIQYTISLF